MTGRSEGVIVCRQGYQSWRPQSAESAARHSLRQQPEAIEQLRTAAPCTPGTLPAWFTTAEVWRNSGQVKINTAKPYRGVETTKTRLAVPPTAWSLAAERPSTGATTMRARLCRGLFVQSGSAWRWQDTRAAPTSPAGYHPSTSTMPMRNCTLWAGTHKVRGFATGQGRGWPWSKTPSCRRLDRAGRTGNSASTDRGSNLT